MKNEINYAIKKLPSASVTVTIRITNEFKVRMWLVRKLVMLAALIAPFNMEVKDEK